MGTSHGADQLCPMERPQHSNNKTSQDSERSAPLGIDRISGLSRASLWPCLAARDHIQLCRQHGGFKPPPLVQQSVDQTEISWLLHVGSRGICCRLQRLCNFSGPMARRMHAWLVSSDAHGRCAAGLTLIKPRVATAHT